MSLVNFSWFKTYQCVNQPAMPTQTTAVGEEAAMTAGFEDSVICWCKNHVCCNSNMW